MLFDRSLQLFDVLGATFPEGGLCLAIPLLALFRGCVYLHTLLSERRASRVGRMTYGLPSPFALLHLGGFLREALLLWFRGGLGEGLFLEGFEFGDRRDAADVGHDPGQRAG